MFFVPFRRCRASSSSRRAVRDPLDGAREREAQLPGPAKQQESTMMPARKNRIPKFDSDEAERKFWARHNVEEFADELDELDVEISPPRSEQIAVRLYKTDLQALQDLARAKGVGHTTLARTVLERWITRARGAMPPKSVRPRPASSNGKLPNRSPQRRSASGGHR